MMPKYSNCKYRWRNKLAAEEAPEQVPAEPSSRRIVELSVLGRQLWCVACKEALSLEHIETEHRRGLGSILLVRCHKCSIVNTVCTDKRHESAVDERNIRFDINFKAAMGTIILFCRNSAFSLRFVFYIKSTFLLRKSSESMR